MKALSIFFALLLLCSCGSDNETSHQTDTLVPTKVSESQSMSDNALHFINDYVTNCNQMKEAVPVAEWVNTSDLASDSLKAQIQKLVAEADPESGLEYDPIFNAQDYPEEGFQLDKVDEAAGVVTVKGKNNAEFKLEMKMVKEKGVWKVGK
jgi:UDP-N-acetylglucosamine pyrophosphorylase